MRKQECLNGTNQDISGMNIPKHIGIIMDGNGRWAKGKLLPRNYGHRKGMYRMIGLADCAFSLGVEALTVFALSTENLHRPPEEVAGLFDLFRTYFGKYARRFAARGIRLRILGDVSVLPQDVQELIAAAQQEDGKETAHCVNIALNYGARAEIVRAVNRAIAQGERVTEKSFASLLYTAGQPDPDLIIRTGGEIRLSNFLLWQAAYAELYFSEKMFPDFSDADLKEAIVAYASRNRRFGRV